MVQPHKLANKIMKASTHIVTFKETTNTHNNPKITHSISTRA